jgi:predicted GIY-YIG superfamily endonuclease
VSGGDTAATAPAGMVYLLHFARPYRHARHYLGYAEDLEQRLARHRAGSGARLLAVIAAAGIDWRLVRTWSGTRTLERRLKGRHSGVRLCPICRGVARRADPVVAISALPPSEPERSQAALRSRSGRRTT